MTNEKINQIYIFFIFLFALGSCFSISLMSITTAVFLVLFIIKAFIERKSIIQKLPKDFLLFMVLYVYRGFTLIINSSIDKLVKLQEIFDKTPYLSLSVVKIDENLLKKFFIVLFVSNSFLIIYGIGELFLNFPEIHKSLFDGIRLKGYFGHPLQYAGYVSIISIVSFSLGMFYKKYFFIPSFLLFTGVVLSGSRSYIISVIIALFILSLFRSIKFSIITLASISSAIFIYIFTSPGFMNRLYYIFHPMESGSFTQRVEMWKKAWEVFLEAPIFGVGYTNFPLYLQELAEKGIISTTAHAHNIYLNELVEGGIIGFLISIGLLVYFIYKYFMEYQKSEDIFYRAISLSLSIVFINLMIAGFLEYNLGTAVIWMLLTFVMGLHLAYKNSLQNAERNN